MWKQFLYVAVAVILLSSLTEAYQFRHLDSKSKKVAVKSSKPAPEVIDIDCHAQLYLNGSWNESNGACTINGVNWSCNSSGCSNIAESDSGSLTVYVDKHPVVIKVVQVIQIIVNFFVGIDESHSCEAPSLPMTTFNFVNNSAVNLTNLYQNQDNVSQSFSCSNNTDNCHYVIGVINCTNVNFDFTCDNSSSCQWLILAQDSTNVTVNAWTGDSSDSHQIILAKNSSNIIENAVTNGTSNASNIIGLYNSSNFSQNHNCSDTSNCSNNVTSYGSWNLDQENWCWGNSTCQHLLWTSDADTVFQQDTCFNDGTNCNNDLECWGENCTNVTQVVNCGGNAVCTNTTGFNDTFYQAVTSDNFNPPCDVDIFAEDFDINTASCNPFNVSTTSIEALLVTAGAPPMILDLVLSPPSPLPEGESSFVAISSELDQFYAEFSDNSKVSQANAVDVTPYLDWINSQNCSMDSGDSCDYTNYAHSVAHAACSGAHDICNETIVSLNGVSVDANWTWNSGVHARNAFILQNADNVNIVGYCADGAYCQNLFILNGASNVNINISCSNLAICDNIIASNNSVNVSEWITCQGQTTCALNVFHQTWSNNSWQWANCSDQSTCGQINTGVNNVNVTQVNAAWTSSVTQDIVVFESCDGLTQNNTCGFGAICQNIATCNVNCNNPVQNNDCADGSVCTNTTALESSGNPSTPVAPVSNIPVPPPSESLQQTVAPPVPEEEETSEEENATEVEVIVIDISTNAISPLEEGESSFGNFSAELDEFYANFSDNSRISQVNAVDESVVLDWVNSQNCSMDSGDECAYTNYTHSVAHSNCSDAHAICNETIVSLINVSAVIANWSWDNGVHARNAFVFQNADNITISGECSNASYCQNLFILSNVSNVNINLSCSANTVCDNIIAAVDSVNITEWIDCHDQATCGLNVFRQVASNNTWQWSNCSALSTCGNIASGYNVSNVNQINNVWDSSVVQDIAVFQNADGLTQNNTIASGCTGQNIETCTNGCNNAVQNNDCQDGSTCANVPTIVNGGEASEVIDTTPAAPAEETPAEDNSQQNSAPAEGEGEGDNSAPAENTSDNSTPAEGEGDNSAPADNSGDNSAPADNSGDNSAPADNSGDNSAPADNSTPADNSGDNSAPADNSGDNSAPADNSTPADNSGDNSAPADNSGDNSAPADNSSDNSAPADNSTPADNSGDNSAPADNSTPADNSGDNSAPADNSGDNSAPADNSGDNSAPADNSTPADNSGDNSAPADNSTPADNSGDNSAPADNSGDNSAPADNSGDNSAPADNSTPADNSGDNSAPADNSTPADNSAPADNSTPADNSAPADNTTPSGDNSAPAGDASDAAPAPAPATRRLRM